MKKKYYWLSVFISILFLLSCSTVNNKYWENLTDRNFYFSRFLFVRKGSENAEVFKRMKDFQVNKLLKIISHKYNINIDSTDFNNFLISGDENRINATGILGKTNFTWKMHGKKDNVIELEYWNRLSLDNVYEIREYKVFIRVQGKTKAQFLGNFMDTVPELVTIAKNMGYERVEENSDNFYVNTENNSKVDLTGIGLDIKSSTAKKDKMSKPELKKIISDFINEMPKSDRKAFRDDLIKYLYQVIE